MNESSNNIRIAKNTILLYCRMLFLLIISLYTSRVILAALGFEDYGIYDVVGGVVTMFTIVSGAMRAATSRFITYELGKNDEQSLQRVFSCTVSIQFILAIIFIVLAESVGLWFLNAKMVIPEDRIIAANWVYQFSIITFTINLISIPYNAAIIAHEKMAAFAYISIMEAIFKLTIAWTISVSPFDKLIYYSLMLVILAIVVRIIYILYCRKKFKECEYSFVYDKNIFKQMFSFSGWNLIGAASAVLRDNGGNIILNLFFGPEVNAARAIAIRVSAAIQGFVQNFQMALNPQIIKNYASGDVRYMNELVFRGARFSFYILFILALPILISANTVLSLWLGAYPDHTELFLKLTVIFALFEALSGTLMTAMYATGVVRNYQLVVGGLQLLNLPISWLFLKFGLFPEIVLVVAVILSFVCLVARLIMLKPLVGIDIKDFMFGVVLNTSIVSLLSFLIVYGITYYIPSDGFVNIIIRTLISVIISVVVILYVGLSSKERQAILKKMLSFLKRSIKRN